ncbi:MAG: FxLYD domain-containing protein [Candidatus Aquicultorales bacterium]
MSRRTIAVLTVFFLGASVFAGGCSSIRRMFGGSKSTTTSTTTTTSASSSAIKELKVKATGFTQSKGGIVSVGLILENTSADKTAESVSVRVELKDKKGNTLGSRIEDISVFPEASTMGVGMAFPLVDDSQKVDTVKAVIDKSGFISVKTPKITTGEATVSQADGSTVVTGTATSPFDKDLQNIKVYTVLTDAKGKVVGGGVSIIDVLPAKGSAPFEVDVLAEIPKAEKAQAYYSLDDLSLILPADIR